MIEINATPVGKQRAGLKKPKRRTRCKSPPTLVEKPVARFGTSTVTPKDIGLTPLDPKKVPPLPANDDFEMTEADIAWWEFNSQMGKDWLNWLDEPETHTCIHCKKEFQTHLHLLRECGCTAS